MVLGIYGAGALGREILEIVEEVNEVNFRWDRVVYLVDQSDEKEKNGLEVISPETFAGYDMDKEVVIAVGEPFARWKMREKIQRMECKLAEPIIHPSCKVSRDATIQNGTVVSYGNCISFNSQIGENVYIQPSGGIGHDAYIGDNSVISAGVRVAGHTKIGRNVYIGLMVPIRDRVSIGEGSIVSMGSVVQRDIPENVIAMGNPARVIKPNVEHKLF